MSINWVKGVLRVFWKIWKNVKIIDLISHVHEDIPQIQLDAKQFEKFKFSFHSKNSNCMQFIKIIVKLFTLNIRWTNCFDNSKRKEMFIISFVCCFFEMKMATWMCFSVLFQFFVSCFQNSFWLIESCFFVLNCIYP